MRYRVFRIKIYKIILSQYIFLQVFKLSEFKQQYENDNISSISTDSESYLEKETLPNVKEEDKMEEDTNCLKDTTSEALDSSYLVAQKVSDVKSKVEYGKFLWHHHVMVLRNIVLGYSTDDETNEMAAKRYEVAYEKYKVELNSIKYDRNTLLQMRESTISSDNIILSCTRPGDLTKSAR